MEINGSDTHFEEENDFTEEDKIINVKYGECGKPKKEENFNV